MTTETKHTPRPCLEAALVDYRDSQLMHTGDSELADAAIAEYKLLCKANDSLVIDRERLAKLLAIAERAALSKVQS